MADNQQRLTLGTVRRHLKALCPAMNVTKTEYSEFRVSVSDSEQSAYYAGDLEDALYSGECMALVAAGWIQRWNEMQSIWQWTATAYPMMARKDALLALRASRSGLGATGKGN